MVSEEKVVKTHCELCAWGCGVDIYVKDGQIVKVEGTPGNPVNRGEICAKAKAMMELVYSPERLKYPLKRDNGGWKRISWDEALDAIAAKLMEIREEYGARALAVYCGFPGVVNFELSSFAQRFRCLFGTPNMLSVESMCFRARIFARQLTFGRYLVEEPENSKCIILWGHNPDASKPPLAKLIYEAAREGLKLIVIDPRRIPLANQGMHIQIRPGTDCALALAMLNVIISQGLYDREFVAEYTIGFDELKQHVRQYTPERVAEISGVTVADIKQLARTYAVTKPAAIVQGINTLDQRINGVQTSRALSILQAVTGNVDVPGGWTTVPFIRLTRLWYPPQERPLGSDIYPLYDMFWRRRSPFGQGMLLPQAILSGKPYPIKALIIAGSNMAVTFPSAGRIKQTLEALDLLVVSDVFMTETAELAHFVLPACTFLERSGVGYVFGVNNGLPYVMLRHKVIEPLWQSWPDWKLFSELGRRMGYKDDFPWETEEEVIAHLLEDFTEAYGITLEQLEQNPDGIFYTPKEYEAYKRIKFGTPSEKVEIYSQTLAEAGYEPLPTYVEPAESLVSTPELCREYPLTLITGARIVEYVHSQLRHVSQLRRAVPEACVEMHPNVAREYGIANGDAVVVETKRGDITLKAEVTEDIMPGVVSIPHGWAQANVNALTDIEARDPISGFPELKPLQCRLRRV